MATLDTDTAPVRSPCIRLCALDDNDICVGCYRSMEEICAWGSASDADKRAILEKAARRGEELRRA